MSFKWDGLWETLRDETFAIWFGWVLGISIIVFPVTTMISSCNEQSALESIEIAKLEVVHGDQEQRRGELLKWMTSRGVHPLVARCAILGSPSSQCASLLNHLEVEERTTIADLLANPFVETVVNSEGEIEVVGPQKSFEYIQKMDFGKPSLDF